jgi:hypothetical protein
MFYASYEHRVQTPIPIGLRVVDFVFVLRIFREADFMGPASWKLRRAIRFHEWAALECG